MENNIFSNNEMKTISQKYVFDIYPSCINSTQRMGQKSFEEITDIILEGSDDFPMANVPRQMTLAEMTRLARQYGKGSKEYDAIKKQMPAFTPAAAFPEGRKSSNPHIYTGMVAIDLDNVPEMDMERIRTKLKDDPHVCCVCQSLSGKGYHIFIFMDGLSDTNYKEAYMTVTDYYSCLLRYPADPSCKDNTRLMILNHDPDAYVNRNAEAWNVTDFLEVTHYIKNLNFSIDMSLNTYLDVVDGNLNMIAGNRHNVLISIVPSLNRAGFDREEVKQELTLRYAESDFTESEISEIVDFVYDRNLSEFGCNKREVQERQNGQKGQESQIDFPAEIDFFEPVHEERPEFESFRDQLPTLVSLCIPKEDSNDIKWAKLFSSIAVFGAMVPFVTFWEEKESHLNSSVIWVGESGTGKGDIMKIRNVFKFYADAVHADQQENIIPPLKEAHRQWENCMEEYKAQKRKKGNKNEGEEPTYAPCDCGEEPIIPEPYRLLVSANTSQTQFIHRLSTNQPYHTVRVEEEIGTITDNSKKDYGVSRSNMRGGLEGGAMSADFKSGTEYVEHAKWTDLIAGTPAAVQSHLDNQEDGSHARYLILPLEPYAGYKRLNLKSPKELKDSMDAMRNRVLTFKTYTDKLHAHVVFDPHIMKILEDRIEYLDRKYREYNISAFRSSIVRKRRQAMCMCSILTVLKASQNNLPSTGTAENPQEIACSEETARLVASWIPYLVYCECQMTATLKKHVVQGIPEEDIQTQALYRQLPCEFKTADLNRIAGALKMTPKTTSRRVKEWQKHGQIMKIHHGKYKKRECTEVVQTFTPSTQTCA